MQQAGQATAASLASEHAALLAAGTAAWNEWRLKNPGIVPFLSGTSFRGAALPGVNLQGANLKLADLSGADLSSADLSGANLSRANLQGTSLYRATMTDAKLDRASLRAADLRHADLTRASLRESDLEQANLNRASLVSAYLTRVHAARARFEKAGLTQANLSYADLSGAVLDEAHLVGVNLTKTDLSGAMLRGAVLECSLLLGTKLEGANLSGARVYGTSAWKLRIEKTVQDNLRVTPGDEMALTTDKIEIAQFIYLILDNDNIRDFFEASKGVLLLGRFTQHKDALEALRRELRKRNLVPIVFDFDRPTGISYTDTVIRLAGMSQFIIANITDPRSVPHELASIPFELPVIPILEEGSDKYSMEEDLKKNRWVAPVHIYKDPEELQRGLNDIIIPLVKRMWEELKADLGKRYSNDGDVVLSERLSSPQPEKPEAENPEPKNGGTPDEADGHPPKPENGRT